MGQSGTYSSGRHLVTVHIDVDTGLLREYLGANGLLWREAGLVLVELLLCIAFSAMQNALPESLPELPLFPAVALVAYLGVRRGAWHAYGMAWLCGLLLDCGCWGRPGVSSLLFALEVLAVRLASPLVRGYLASTLMTGGTGALVWIGLRLVCFAMGMPIALRLRQIPQLLVCGSILTGLIFTPLFFSLFDLLPTIFRGRHVHDN